MTAEIAELAVFLFLFAVLIIACHTGTKPISTLSSGPAEPRAKTIQVAEKVPHD